MYCIGGNAFSEAFRSECVRIFAQTCIMCLVSFHRSLDAYYYLLTLIGRLASSDCIDLQLAGAIVCHSCGQG